MPAVAAVLAAVYLVLATWSCGQLAWVHFYSKLWTLQKSFHILIVVMAASALTCTCVVRPGSGRCVADCGRTLCGLFDVATTLGCVTALCDGVV
jgi:hypothetical protein